MTRFKITHTSQSVQHLLADDRMVARIVNGPKGWMAHRGLKDIDPAPVNVSRQVNQHDGGRQIAELLGLA